MTIVRGALAGTGSTARLVWDDPNLRRTSLALLGSTVGDGAYAVALAVYAFQWGGPVLHTLARADFLQAVGADPEAAARADLLVSTRIDR